MSNRILALGIADSVNRVTPPARAKARNSAVGPIARTFAWLAVAAAVLIVLRAFA